MTIDPNVITGLVGIAGVAGAIVSARLASRAATRDLKLGIKAENERLMQAEKHRIYVRCLTAATEFITEIGKVRWAVHYGDAAKYRVISERMFYAQAVWLNSIAELELIAPENIQAAVKDVKRYVKAQMMVTAENPDSTLAAMGLSPIPALRKAMRSDLGMPIDGLTP